MTMSTWTVFHVAAAVLLSTVWATASDSTTTPTTTSLVTATTTQASIIDLFSNTTLRKCKCGADEVLDGSICRRETTVALVMDTQFEMYAMNTSTFSSVAVAKVQCPDALPTVLLDFNNLIIIMPSGQLFWNYEKLFEDYCVEHVQRDGQAFLEAYVCLPPPAVPRCCPPGHVLGPDDSCVAHSLQDFAPPVSYNNELLQWASVDGDVKNITCEGLAVARHVNLNNVEGNLAYTYSQAILMWKPSAESPLLKQEEEYCVGVELDGKSNAPIYVAKMCYVDPLLHHQHTCTNNTCVRKCCPENKYIHYECADVQSEEEVWRPIFHSNHSQSVGILPSGNLTIIPGFPLCSSYFKLNSHVDDKEESFLLPDGSLHVPLYGRNYPSTEYCLDYFKDETGALVRDAVLCHPEQTEDCLWKDILIVVLLAVSCVFLAATMAVYLGVAELRDRTNGRCLISMVSAMLTAYISIICNKQIRNQSDAQCIASAFVGHVSTLATFFWLNVMCYDMWSTLRSSHQQHHSMKRFLLYSLYAWGCPLVVGVVTVIIDSQETSNLIRPRFTEATCWFHGDAEYWLYLHGIICILVLANLFFFVHVAVTLSRKLKQRRKVFETSTSHSSNSTKTREQAWLYIKLFVVMGVVWIADILSSVQHRNTCTYWVLTDIINGLQGVFIFIVAVCNRDNMKKIRAAWRPRIESAQKTVSTLRGTTIRSNKDQRSLSVATSEASRKTSVTSLPRKISVASIFFPNSNKAKRTTQLSDTSESSRKSANTSAPRKVSTVSNLEVIPMTTMDE